MKYLLDTHILIWALMNRPELSLAARNLIGDKSNHIFYSAVSVWEVSLKHQLHPNSIPCSVSMLLLGCEAAGFGKLPLQNEHILVADAMRREEGAPPHRDPFDRVLLAQALAERMTFLTHDKTLRFYLHVDIEIV